MSIARRTFKRWIINVLRHDRADDEATVYFYIRSRLNLIILHTVLNIWVNKIP